KANEPWLLVGRLPDKIAKKPNAVIRLFKTRMEIEENFRDTKNARLGISLEYARSTTPERYDNLLLIAALILFVLWVIGYAAYYKNYHKSLQANTISHRRVLSYIYLGREVVGDRRYHIDDKTLMSVMNTLALLARTLDELL
ncbi:MAG: IS4 family transposase, partial [Gammaproteobacteria bacterium]